MIWFVLSLKQGTAQGVVPSGFHQMPRQYGRHCVVMDLGIR